MSTTPRGYRYPAATDTVNVNGAIQNLATDVDTDVGSIASNVSSLTTRVNNLEHVRYGGAVLAADYTATAGGVVLTMALAADPQCDAGWSIVSNQLVKPVGLSGKWRANVGSRCQNSGASSSTSYRRVQVTGVSGSNLYVLAVSETHGHRASIEADIFASGKAFDMSTFDKFQLDIIVDTDAGNKTFYANSWQGPSNVWAGGISGTWFSLERIEA